MDSLESRHLIKQTLRDFTQEHLVPYAEELDEKEEFNFTAFRMLGDLGMLGMTVSEEYGGSGLGCYESLIAMDELAYGCASTTLSYLAHSILCVNNIYQNASHEQKLKYLPELISGKKIGAMAMTEPGSGSDALGMMTKATKDGDDYIIHGSKTFITNGPDADVFVLYAKTGESKKSISTFIFERGTPGFSVSKKFKKMGMRASPTAELSFDHCRIPASALVGQENDSVSHMMKNLTVERITISGISLGLARAAIDYTVQYAKERKQFNKTLAEMEAIQQKIADMVTEAEAAQALVYQSAELYDAGSSSATLGAQSKLFSAQIATKVCLEAIQILGGYGYIKEYPVERFMRDAKLMEIGAGTNEIMRKIIADKVLQGKER